MISQSQFEVANLNPNWKAQGPDSGKSFWSGYYKSGWESARDDCILKNYKVSEGFQVQNILKGFENFKSPQVAT